MLWQALIAIILTLLTQIGGVIWLISRLFKRKILAFLMLYVVVSIALTGLAPLWGQKRLPCVGLFSGSYSNTLYCVLNRNFASTKAANLINRIGMGHVYDGNQKLETLDAGFPFTGMPLLPHLSHKDGKKIDIALPYRNAQNRRINGRSPLGYFAFEFPDTETCPKTFPSLRWDLRWLQGLWPDYRLDEAQLKTTLLDFANDERVEKIFIEPHLARRVGASHPKIRFQGCKAARHDDHIHVQIK